MKIKKNQGRSKNLDSNVVKKERIKRKIQISTKAKFKKNFKSNLEIS